MYDNTSLNVNKAVKHFFHFYSTKEDCTTLTVECTDGITETLNTLSRLKVKTVKIQCSSSSKKIVCIVF